MYKGVKQLQERISKNINPLLKKRGIVPLTEDEIKVYGNRVGEDVCYGSGLDDALEILSKTGRKKDANRLVFSRFSATGPYDYLWNSDTSFKKALEQFVEYGDKKLLPQISMISLERGYDDFACMAAYESKDKSLVKTLAERRLEQMLKLTPKEDISSESNASGWAMRLFEKAKETKGLEKVRDWFLVNGSYHAATRPAGMKFKIDGNQADLDRATALFAKYKFMENMIISPEWGKYADILYEPEIDENNRIERIGKFRRYWKDGKVERVEETDEKSQHGRFFVGNSYRLPPCGSVEQESLSHYEDVGDGVNSMPVMKKYTAKRIAPKLKRLLQGEIFETNKYMENIGGMMPHINAIILNPKKSALKEARKAAKEVLESLPRKEYEKPVPFDIGGDIGMKIETFTGVLDDKEEHIYGYPKIKGTVFDVGVKQKTEEYRIKVGVFSGNNSDTNEIFVGGTKSVLTNNLPAETREVRERMTGIRNSLESTFSERFNEENFWVTKTVYKLMTAMQKEFKEKSQFSSFGDLIKYQVKNAGGAGAYRKKLKLGGFNDSLIGKIVDCAKN